MEFPSTVHDRFHASSIVCFMNIISKTPVSKEEGMAAKAKFCENRDRMRDIDHEIAEIERSLKEKVEGLKAESELLSSQNHTLKGKFSPLEPGRFYSVTAYRFVGKMAVFHCKVECLTNGVVCEVGENHDKTRFENHVWGTGKVIEVTKHPWGFSEFKLDQIVELYQGEVDPQPLEKEGRTVFVPAKK